MRTLDWFVNRPICTWYALILCPFISKSDSSAVESSPHNPWIEGSRVEIILPFQYHGKSMLFLWKLLILYPEMSLVINEVHEYVKSVKSINYEKMTITNLRVISLCCSWIRWKKNICNVFKHCVQCLLNTQILRILMYGCQSSIKKKTSPL